MTEYQIDSKDLGDAGVALSITRWLCLGEGRTQMDENWQKHVSAFEWKPGHPRVSFEPGSICGSFESSTCFDIDRFLNPGKVRELLERGGTKLPRSPGDGMAGD